MTCERREPALALYVEGDLERDESAAVELHLAACLRCQAFLSELRASQAALKALATEALDEQALGTVRAGVRAALGRRGAEPSSWRGPWRWVLACSFVFGAVGARIAWQPHPRSPRSVPPVAVPAVPADEAAVGPATEANPALAQASVAVTSPGGARPRTRVRRTPAFGLSPEDADQLARAVVALARVERVPTNGEIEPEPGPPAAPALVRLATGDPDVVIYWQLDSDGG